MAGSTHQVCLLLGSNIQPEKNLRLAVAHLREALNILKISSVWRSPLVGSAGPNVLNAAVLASTSLTAGDFKTALIRPTEARLGRVRLADKNAPRTIDIDLILYDQQLLDDDLWVYAHRSVPVAELLPEYRSTTGETLGQVAARLAAQERIWLREDISLSSSSTADGYTPN